MLEAIKCIVTTSTEEFPLHVEPEPGSACVACSRNWSSNALLWCPHKLTSDLFEIYGVMLNMAANVELSIPLSTDLVSDDRLLLLIVLKFELNREYINKVLPHYFDCIF